MLMESAREYRALGAPAGDAETLVDPPFAELPAISLRNLNELPHLQYEVQGRSLPALAESARRNLFEAARRYTRQYRSVPDRWLELKSTANVPFILSGHQPELFHPGVWYKNFVLGALAKKLDGVGIHLLIDSDTCEGASIRVPSGTVEQPHLDAVAYDEPAAEVPYEERTIRDLATFSRFAERVASHIRHLVGDPLVVDLWQRMMERNPAQHNLGLRLAQGRHALEETWHNETLELPQSVVCELPEFAWFVAHLLAHLPRFWAAHNDALAHYRRTHKLRNRAQPVPDLDLDDGWLEAPFWIWSADDPARRPLYAKQLGDEILLSDRRSRQVALRLSAEGDAALAAEQLLALPKRGIKLRTRALTTTLFARLVLSDLFLHGIGGAKYDQVTDHIVRLFFGFEPPEFATVSATLRLPLVRASNDALQAGQWQQRLRDLKYHPEQFIQTNGDAAVAKLVADKRQWVQTVKTPANAHERHFAIASANSQMQPFVAALREQIENERDDMLRRKRGEAILRSREYSFCLYPRQHFDELLTAIRS
jgi:hypothetical protein